ncbi:hypothetical protein EW026_g7115 [Hermanssonia centrifuga]|uniref:Uncharacterized protein n=1 Tax=Hermanssonia centrifuga TaxID=98765 RepID=A0A4S4K9X2_9APHY|nr:hypothetical protein EW026_g7115 [Hermanssonia centrifuga]
MNFNLCIYGLIESADHQIRYQDAEHKAVVAVYLEIIQESAARANFERTTLVHLAKVQELADEKEKIISLDASRDKLFVENTQSNLASDLTRACATNARLTSSLTVSIEAAQQQEAQLMMELGTGKSKAIQLNTQMASLTEKAENQFILQVEQSIYKGQHEETSDELESKKKAQVFPEKEKDEMAAKLEAALAKIEAMKLEAQAERTRFMELQITRKSDVCTNILQDGQSFQSCLS